MPFFWKHVICNKWSQVKNWHAGGQTNMMASETKQIQPVNLEFSLFRILRSKKNTQYNMLALQYGSVYNYNYSIIIKIWWHLASV